LKIAHAIGKTVWGQRGDIRDVISIGKLVRKNDVPEEVEEILATMIKNRKKTEFRVTVIGNVLHAAEIHSQESEKTKHDWRLYDDFAKTLMYQQSCRRTSRRKF
jgi:hypothetical protein